MIELLLALGAVLAGGTVALAVSNRVRQAVASWLRRHGLRNSALMRAVFIFDNVGSRVRRRLKVETAYRTEVVDEEYLSEAQVRRELAKIGVSLPAYAPVEVDITSSL